MFLKTNKTLLSISNKFNSSLFMHFNILPLEIPPLRKHAYDIPLLVEHFLTQEKNAHSNKSVILSTSALRQLRNYSWPGNIAELAAVIKKITALAPADHHVITPYDLVLFWGEKQTEFIEKQSFLSFASLDEATRTFQKNFLHYLLKKNHYNFEQVSSQLSMNQSQLRNKLLELNIAQTH